MAEKALDKLTVDELVAENQKLGAQVDKIRERRFEIKAILDQRDAEERAKLLLDGLDETQIQAVAALATVKRGG